MFENFTFTDEQVSKLEEIHAKDYMGTDDDMPEAFEAWIVSLLNKSDEEVLNLLK